MYRAVALAGLLGLLAAMPLSAQQATSSYHTCTVFPDEQPAPVAPAVSPLADPVSPPDGVCLKEPPPWYAAWGLAGFRVIPTGPRIAPNGVEYHPNFSMDLEVNFWLWHSQRLYLFTDMRFWGEKSEFGVTNQRDGFWGTSKREFDISGGVAWNYSGPWEARVFGYSYSNLNRGVDPVAPDGFNDGWALENRYYLSSEYAKLGETGFDVTRASFVSFGYYPSKDLVGNDGQRFHPGLFLRAYLTCDLWDWPAYAFADAEYLSDSTLSPRLMLFDVGVAARPIPCCRQMEFRLGTENVADFQVDDIKSLWYASVRFVF
jgi:hypothetical protein